jgi:hypothetical protein
MEGELKGREDNNSNSAGTRVLPRSPSHERMLRDGIRSSSSTTVTVIVIAILFHTYFCLERIDIRDQESIVDINFD